MNNKFNLRNLHNKKLQIIKELMYQLLNQNIKDTYSKNQINNKIKINNSKLLKYNNILDYNNNIYNFNTFNILNILHKDKIVNYFIKQLMTQLVFKHYLKIHYSGPIFNHTINKLNIIIFIYKPKTLSLITKTFGISLWSRLINKLINYKFKYNIINDKNINQLLSNLYNKEVIIEPIYLTYDYLDSNILSNTISHNIYKYNQYKGLYSNIILKNIPLINVNNILYNKINNIKYLNKLLVLKNISQLSNIPFKYNSQNRILNGYINNNNTINQLLLYQYIIGYDWIYKGKLAKSDSNARSIYSLKQYGTLNSGILSTTNGVYRLNNKSSHLTINNKTLINKNGKYNISVTLSHI